MTTRQGDYDELVSLADSVNSMAARLEGSRDRERQVLLSVSHDLRTPLTSIRGYAEAIEDGVSADPASAARVIVAESRRLERLVADLLDLAKLETQHLSLRLDRVDAGSVAVAAAEAARPLAARRSVAVEVAPAAPGSALVTADPDRLGQVVANLIENAVAHAGSRIAVRVGHDVGGSIAISIDDDGPGIPPEDLGRVFDRFYQVDRGSSARGGSGLGLAIVAELTRAMGGTVEAESPSPSGAGTRMVVHLPAAVPTSAPTPTPGAPAAAATSPDAPASDPSQGGLAG